MNTLVVVTTGLVIGIGANGLVSAFSCISVIVKGIIAIICEGLV